MRDNTLSEQSLEELGSPTSKAAIHNDECYHNLGPQQIQSKSVFHVSDVGKEWVGS